MTLGSRGLSPANRASAARTRAAAAAGLSTAVGRLAAAWLAVGAAAPEQAAIETATDDATRRRRTTVFMGRATIIARPGFPPTPDGVAPGLPRRTGPSGREARPAPPARRPSRPAVGRASPAGPALVDAAGAIGSGTDRWFVSAYRTAIAM